MKRSTKHTLNHLCCSLLMLSLLFIFVHTLKHKVIAQQMLKRLLFGMTHQQFQLVMTVLKMLTQDLTAELSHKRHGVVLMASHNPMRLLQQRLRFVYSTNAEQLLQNLQKQCLQRLLQRQ
ncbi:MAG: hypothetical protein EBT95_00600 [Verrucomicrobia bacterium]|nr:hypothetical protein [Verrucomicrobiota bacterium]